MIWWMIGGWVLMLVIGVGVYYGWTVLPAEWRAKVAGVKTTSFAAVVAFAPDLLTILVELQAMSYMWEPSPTINIVMKVVAGLIIALRYITSHEQKEDL